MDALFYVLDLGDRLADALDAGDLDGAAEMLRAREAAVEALLAAPPEVTPALAERVRHQEIRLGAAAEAARRHLQAAADDVRRTASAAARYHPAAASGVLDTAPRTG